MAEVVELHGGPVHGTLRTLPFSAAKALEVESLIRIENETYRRRGRYTRVHDIQGRPKSEFEWSGYVTNLLPLEDPSVS